jgi:hypothetical protein
MLFWIHVISCLITLLAVSQATKNLSEMEYNKPPVWKRDLKVYAREDLPVNFTWANHQGENWLTPELKELYGVPSCNKNNAPFAAVVMLSDRVQIMRGDPLWDPIFIRQSMILCNFFDVGCFGGVTGVDLMQINRTHPRPDVCEIYEQEGHPEAELCQVFGVESHGNITGELNIMNEVIQRGPVMCTFDVPRSFHDYPNHTYRDPNITRKQQSVTIVGWGEELDTDPNVTEGDRKMVNYWTVRSTYWLEETISKVIRGVNYNGLETNCTWLIPCDHWANYTSEYTDFPIPAAASDENDGESDGEPTEAAANPEDKEKGHTEL